MKTEHRKHYRLSARAFLANINAAVGQDFHTLTRTQVDLVLLEANRVRYQQPKNANGSRAAPRTTEGLTWAS